MHSLQNKDVDCQTTESKNSMLKDYTDAEIRAIFNKVYGGTELTKEEILKFKSAMLVIFAEMDWETGWAQQYHYGAIRDNNSKMFKLLGPDTGFDSIGESTQPNQCRNSSTV